MAERGRPSRDAGLNGGPRRRGISKAEVAEHKTPEDAWVILRGKVYNLTPYMPFHPGGKAILLSTAGKDCTALFDKYHRWVNSDFLLKNCLIGLVE
jgi:cytochrome-b5 reductase